MTVKCLFVYDKNRWIEVCASNRCDSLIYTCWKSVKRTKKQIVFLKKDKYEDKIFVV